VSAYVINPYAFAEERIVNGDFSNVTGMTSNSANWWGRKAPVGWNTFVNVSSNDFLVRLLGAVFYANLGTLSRSPIETGGILPFFQDFVMPATSDITLTFVVSNPFNANSWAMAANIVDTTTNQLLASAPSFSTPQIVTMTASSAAAGHAVRINFWKGAASHTPALSNVSVTF
jgi:hypothetical protein